METARLKQGQLVLPKAVIESYGWENEVEFLVEVTEEGLLLKPLRLFPTQTIEEVFGCLHYSGPAKSLEEMDRAVAEEAKARR